MIGSPLIRSIERPLFSAVGQIGFKSLPPEAAAAIDRLKQERRIRSGAFASPQRHAMRFDASTSLISGAEVG